MEKDKKIGFFEKWNPDAQKVEFSITRVQMIVMTLAAIGFMFWYYTKYPVTMESILQVGLLLLASFFPKALKDFMDKR